MTYSGDALDVVISEVRRTRDLQSSRLGNLRGTASILIGASGIASGLLSAAAENRVWLIPIALFLLAAGFGLAVIWPTSGQHVQPRLTFEQAAGESATQVKANVAAGIIAEYGTQESRVASRARLITIGAVVFLLGIASIIVVTLTTDSSAGDEPQRVVIQEPVTVEIHE